MSLSEMECRIKSVHFVLHVLITFHSVDAFQQPGWTSEFSPPHVPCDIVSSLPQISKFPNAHRNLDDEVEILQSAIRGQNLPGV